MLIAGSVDLTSALADLAGRRPLFHSEADFQHALAWHVHLCDPAMQVRLETRPVPGMRLDLEFLRPDLARSTAVEVKYLTRGWVGEIDGEHYELKNQGAQDIRGYDVVKDIHRVERFTATRAGLDAAVIVLANDGGYWRPGAADRDTNAAAFRLGEGTVLTGSHAWGPRTGAGTRKGREETLNLHGTYETRWTDYSTLPGGGPASKLRLLVIEVTAVA
jgi:hypothetical protein